MGEIKKHRKKREEGPSKRMQAFVSERMAGAVAKEHKRQVRSRRVKNPDSVQKLLTQNHVNALRQFHQRQKNWNQGLIKIKPKGRKAKQAIVAPPGNNWIPIGPSVVRKGQAANMPKTSGRARGIALSPNGQRLYVASANGGVWRSEDGGNSWKPLMDGFDQNMEEGRADSLSCGALAVVFAAQKENDIIYVGSGETHFSAYTGVGPIVSNDGGRNWITEPSTPAPLIGGGFYELAVDPGNPNAVVGATNFGLYLREPDGNGGWTWTEKVIPAASGFDYTSVAAARTGNTTTFFAAERGGVVYSSTDGNTWNALGTGFPTQRVNRISLAVQPNNPTVIYALVTLAGNPGPPAPTLQEHNLHGLYRLDTTDGTWRNVTGVPNTLFDSDPTNNVGQGDWDMAIGINPTNVNEVCIGGSTAFSDPTGNISAVLPGEWSASLYRCAITVAGANVSAVSTYIGGSVHADVHAIVYHTVGTTNQLWVCCDGGVFLANNPSGTGMIFTAMNNGLQTLTITHIGQHPTEESVVFAGTQDNGGLRFTGEEAWLHSSAGDCGYVVINWNNPYQILDTYTNNFIRRSVDGGSRYAYTPTSGNPNVSVPINNGEGVLFYAPLVGAPVSGTPAHANIVAFGSERPWISTTFGGNINGTSSQGDWRSIPNNTFAGDRLGSTIRSMVFATARILYVGTSGGRVYRFSSPNDNWTGLSNANRNRIDNDGANSLSDFMNDVTNGFSGPITSIAVSPTNNNHIYVTIGGGGNYQHVWFWNGANWQQRSGATAGGATSLLDVQHNAIIVNPNNANHLYVGADIGVWHSPDAGTNWIPFSEGLPDAAILDIKLLLRRMNAAGTTQIRPDILRVATHGRGVFERSLDVTSKTPTPVELFIRTTQLDQGRYDAIDNLNDPLDNTLTPPAPGGYPGDPTLPLAVKRQVNNNASPDIKIDIPDAAGNYQHAITKGADLSFAEFVDNLNDSSQAIPIHTTQLLKSRVHVKVHNRGVIRADKVKVILLLAPTLPGIPSLPFGFSNTLRNGGTINENGWITLGVKEVSDIRVGFPKVVSFDLDSSNLPPLHMLSGNDQFALVALVHHDQDRLDSIIRVIDNLSAKERKAAQKNIKLVPHAGTLPSALTDTKTIKEFVSIPTQATQANGAFDNFLTLAFRQNDALFHQLFSQVLASPLVGFAEESYMANPAPQHLAKARIIKIDLATELLPRVPLIWFAHDKITINKTINGKGKGANKDDASGDFGGSGGGGSSAAGKPCLLPISNTEIIAAAASGAAGNDLLEDWSSRIFSLLAFAKGGSAGGGANGGAGGGIVVLCAPTIEFGEEGKIDVSGADGGANSGGGGGGLVLLMANNFIGVETEKIILTGGSGAASGGNGLLIQKTIS